MFRTEESKGVGPSWLSKEMCEAQKDKGGELGALGWGTV